MKNAKRDEEGRLLPVSHPSRRALALAIALCTPALWGAACDSFYVVSGRIVDCADQAPIADADVRLELQRLQKKGRGQTDPSGGFQVALNTPPGEEASELVVEKQGYAPLHATVANPETPQKLCLQRLHP